MGNNALMVARLIDFLQDEDSIDKLVYALTESGQHVHTRYLRPPKKPDQWSTASSSHQWSVHSLGT